MKIKDVVRAQKNVTDWGSWKPGPVPRKEFPLSRVKNKRYSIGPSYRWRIISFEALSHSFRVWILFRPDLEKYQAHLGVMRSGDMAVLASYEFHGTHPGWHVHAACGKENEVVPGRLARDCHRRIPSVGGWHRKTTFSVSEQNAVDIAAEVFGLYTEAGGLLL